MSLIGVNINHMEIQVKMGNVASEPMIVVTEFKQGDALSPVMSIWNWKK